MIPGLILSDFSHVEAGEWGWEARTLYPERAQINLLTITRGGCKIFEKGGLALGMTLILVLALAKHQPGPK